jgi:hypothetical protein
VLGVVIRADAKEPQVEQANGTRQHHRSGELAHRQPLGRIAPRLQICADAPSQSRQRFSEAEHRVELCAVAVGAPALVVEVLLAPGCVEAGGLQMAQRVCADPDLAPRRRDRKRADALAHLSVVYALSCTIEVLESATSATPRESGGSAV